jgi:flagellar biogenesis protein FliO
VVGLFSICALAFKKFWKSRAESSVGGAGLMSSLGKFARQMAPNASRSKKMIEVISNHHLGPKKSIAVVRVAGRMLVLGITDEAINLITQIGDGSEELEDGVDATDLSGILAAETKKAYAAPSAQNVKGAGAMSAGPAIFSDILQSETTKPALGTPVANNKLARPQTTVPAPQRGAARDARVMNYGAETRAPQMQAETPKQALSPQMAQAAVGLSGVRAQIKNKLEGLKQI